jgi:AcrR family transcriptional regulator
MPATSVNGDDTRARVLGVAVELIGYQGFAATSTREVCERMGFTKAALYYHFKTKDELLSALVAPVIADLQALVDGGTVSASAAARRGVLVGYVDVVSRHVELIRVLSDDPSVRHRPALAPFYELQVGLDRLLSGDPAPGLTARTRVRAALGGVRAALLRADADDDPTVVREAAIAAGCGALGIPAPRTR